MMRERSVSLLSLEGRRVSVAFQDGSRIDECQLISAGRGRLRSLWLFVDGEDLFIAIADVVDVWERTGPWAA
jgi:hypothetical protein